MATKQQAFFLSYWTEFEIPINSTLNERSYCHNK